MNVYNEDHRNNQSENSIQKIGRKPIKATSGLLVAFLLILLSIVPNIFGSLRVTELVFGAEITQNNARFFASPLPIMLHILFAIVYSILGAFQFAAGFRARFPSWHRVVGRILIVCGFVVGLTAIWMPLFYSRPPGTGELHVIFRLLFGSAMVGSIYLGFTAIRKGDVLRHRAWMIRTYAIALGAGTQVLTPLIGLIIFPTRTELSGALELGAGWVINLAVAELIIRKRPNRVTRA